MHHRLLVALTASALICAHSFAVAPDNAGFLAAQPAWPEGRAKERNLCVAFRAIVDCKDARSATLRLTASTLYRAFVNGSFAGDDPARGTYALESFEPYTLRYLKLMAFEGRLPTPDGPIVLRWTKEGNALAYRLDLPAGYAVEVENLSTLALTRTP